MKLADFYDRIAPFMLGEIGHEEVVSALWGKSPPRLDASRLRIYGRFCRNHRFETLEYVYSECRSAVVAALGERAWADTVEDYFTAHPMHHFELNRNGEYFGDFLASDSSQSPRWPPFLAALADLEWWEWQAVCAPDDPADAEPDAGPLRLGSTVELRPYAFDLISWLDDYEPGERPAAPEAESIVVLFWRDRHLSGRREKASPLEMLVIKAVVESVPLDAALAAKLQVEPATLAETVADLHAAGVILGSAELFPATAG